MNWAELSSRELLRSCAAAGNSAAWEEFLRRYHSVISAGASRVGRAFKAKPADIDDAIQEIYLKICANQARLLNGIEGEEPAAVFGYLKAVATNGARDFFRRRNAAKRGGHHTESLEGWQDRLGILPGIEREITLSQLEEILHRLTITARGERDRTIFRLYFRTGMTASAIAQLPGVGLNPKGVEAVLFRLTNSIREIIHNPQEDPSLLRIREGGNI